MPYKPEEDAEKVSKETDSGLIAKQEPTSPSKLIKPMLHESEDKRINSKENEVNSGSETRGKGLNKESVVKTIPVKQVEQNEKLPKGMEKKITQDGRKKKKSSPTKSSKLPPVCLRGDPLPRKKSSNGSSRSPSPPGRKGKSVESHSDSSKFSILSNEKENVQLDKSSTKSMPEKSIEVEPSKSKTKVVEVAQGMTKEDKLQDGCTISPDLKCQTNEPKDRPERVDAKAQSSNERHQREMRREKQRMGRQMQA
ncbi:hypothetical protein CQW23_05644 [Capsicum baccatum]|uniref:Uncharacterized protein n=1 Tax=Capsicum baccatum TaxID=33114 RepID=A0A2G2XI39_CAPBA|nr:hypothetical protein CQW23_05644 [Capsicum baccatum]